MYIIFLIKYEIFFSFLHFFVTTHPLLKTASEKFSPHHLHFLRLYIPPLKVASDSWVCVKGEVSFAPPSPHSPLKGARGMLSPTAYDLRPITSSSFFRLETPFLTFLSLLYHIINQSLIYPFYTNRPRFV